MDWSENYLMKFNLDSLTLAIIDSSDSYLTDMYILGKDNQNNLWFMKYDTTVNSLKKYNVKDNQWSTIALPDELLNTSIGGSFICDKKNNIWLNSDRGLIEFNEDGFTSVEVCTNSDGIKLYPNPILEGALNIDISAITANLKDVEIYSTIGTLLFKDKVINNNTIITVNIRTFPSGVYLVKLNNDYGNIVKSFIVQK